MRIDSVYTIVQANADSCAQRYHVSSAWFALKRSIGYQQKKIAKSDERSRPQEVLIGFRPSISSNAPPHFGHLMMCDARRISSFG
jgi:hypothetical protein